MYILSFVFSKTAAHPAVARCLRPCQFALACANFCVLNASYCPNISLKPVRLHMLTVLKLENCEGITFASVAAISHSYMLESGSLSWKLVLRRQESLTALALQSHHLKEVDLSDCESLVNSICEVFGDGGGCPILKSLFLDNCKFLTAVGLCTTSLVSLSLAGCRAITFLELTCPYLEVVHLDGCDHIERTLFCPVDLQSLNIGICPKLNFLRIEAPHLVLLELKGCGVLSKASFNYPLLACSDASFCRSCFIFGILLIIVFRSCH
ncbi:hypothetical protein Nepgr_012597 [Nepenthes gracilis]|uniref:Uncharacterized protein n=1 Tax=Nepenthes gracilis TaxID=150966 RepID=A0AAD3XNH9_NEPGR|nr:hypothetical protein Nepgr_012597 [Nepenthes gracilis]